MRQAARMDEALDRLAERDEGADEDGENNRQAGETLSFAAAKEESAPERDRGERLSEVMDQIGEERDAQRPRVDERLHERRQRQDPEAQETARMPACERRIDRSTSVRVLVFVVLEFDESERRLLGFMLFLVLTKHRAVWGAEMAHPTLPDEQLFPLP